MTASPACRAWLTQHHASVVLHPSRAVHAPVMVLHTATRAVQLRRPGSAGGRGAGAHRGGRAAAAAGGAAGAGGQPGAEAGGRGRLHGPRAGRRGGRRRRGPRRRGALPGRDGRHARGGGRAAHAGARPRARPFPAACRAGPAPRARARRGRAWRGCYLLGCAGSRCLRAWCAATAGAAVRTARRAVLLPPRSMHVGRASRRSCMRWHDRGPGPGVRRLPRPRLLLRSRPLVRPAPRRPGPTRTTASSGACAPRPPACCNDSPCRTPCTRRAQARVFQNSRCALSGAPLELPAVHFLCGHSFNARALSEGERECPLCAPQFRTILDIRRSLRAGAAEQARARPLAPPGRRLARHAYTLLTVCLLCENVKQREAWVCRQAGRTMMAPPVPAEH